jgi:ribosomal-protein-alanine N-acetyltransferase
MLSFNFNPFPLLETERLYLREISDKDQNEVLAIRSDKQIMQYIPRPLIKTTDEAVAFIKTITDGIEKNELVNWAIALKTDNKLIGMIGFYRMQPENHRAEVGYILHTNFQKKGIMQEAITCVIDYGFTQIKLHTIEGVIDPRNTASENVLLKNSFVKEAHFRENFLYQGEFLDSVHYSLLNPFN